MNGKPSQAVKLILLVAAAWLGIMLILAALARSHGSPERAEPALPVYKDASIIEEQRSEPLGWHKIVYRAPVDYPLLAVYHYCDRELTRRGWTREVPKESLPVWTPRRDAKRRYWVARAKWRDQKSIYRIELEMMTMQNVTRSPLGDVAAEAPEPGLIVSCVAARILIPPQ